MRSPAGAGWMAAASCANMPTLGRIEAHGKPAKPAVADYVHRNRKVAVIEAKA